MPLLRCAVFVAARRPKAFVWHHWTEVRVHLTGQPADFAESQQLRETPAINKHWLCLYWSHLGSHSPAAASLHIVTVKLLERWFVPERRNQANPCLSDKEENRLFSSKATAPHSRQTCRSPARAFRGTAVESWNRSRRGHLHNGKEKHC